LSFTPGAREDFIGALQKKGTIQGDQWNVKYQIEAREQDSVKKSGRWVGYAAHALIVRFWHLAKVSNIISYIYIHCGLTPKTESRLAGHLASFVWLHSDARHFYPPFPCLTKPRLQLLAHSCRPFDFHHCFRSRHSNRHVSRDPVEPRESVSLVEALPFLVCTVGFDKPLRLARAVFTHPHITRPAVQEGHWRGQMKPAGDVVLEALDQVGNGILRDYILEMAVLLVGANSRVGHLREFSALAVLVLALDCFMVCTFYTAILTVMIEVRFNLHDYIVVALYLIFTRSIGSTNQTSSNAIPFAGEL
jgi:hydroxymethylglutaryl-CoA reductase (NADPH)